MSELLLKPHVALVSGGTSGIGAAISEALLASGYRVAANYADRHAAADAFATRTGIPVFSWNVADLDACLNGVARVHAALGPVDVLVNNAGITHDVMLHKMTATQWREVIDVDLGGCFNMCRAVIDGMRERRFGRVVNISSVNALSGQAGQTNYAAAKAGMIGFTKSLALEGATRSITVNAIAPGYTDTAMVSTVPPDVLERILKSVPAGRLASAAEIARGVVFLVADESAPEATTWASSIRRGRRSRAIACTQGTPATGCLRPTIGWRQTSRCQARGGPRGNDG